MTRSFRALVTVTVALFILAPVTAVHAGSDEPVVINTTVTDPDDTAGPLDLVRVAHRIIAHPDGATFVRYRVHTSRAFDDSDLSWRHRHFILELDRDGQSGSEFNVTIYADNGELIADLISNATRKVVREIRVHRVNASTLQIRGSTDVLGARKYFWTSNFHRSGVPRCGWSGGWPITCQDTVPDRGWLRLDRLGWPPSAD